MTRETIYDHPRAYDVLFGWDRSREAELYHRAFLRGGARPGDPVLEVACGTGHVARLLARRGWRAAGLDLRPAMLAHLRERATEEGVAVATLCGDMRAFRCPEPFAAAFNPMSSFRLLHRDEDAEAHLRSMAAALRPGGVYVLDLTLDAPEDPPAPTTDEAWEMTRGELTVRAEDEGVTVREGDAERRLAWGEELHLRSLTPASFAERVAAVPGLELVAWHPERSRATGVSEFDDAPAREGPARGRVMVVLRRRPA